MAEHMKPEETARELKVREAARLYCTGKSLRAVAEALGVSEATAWRWVHKARELWRREVVASFDGHVADQLMEIDAIKAEAWAAWERSKGEAYKVTEERERGRKAYVPAVRLKEERKRQVGDARFLDIIAKAEERKAKLLGLDSPEKGDQPFGNTPIEVSLHIMDVGPDK